MDRLLSGADRGGQRHRRIHLTAGVSIIFRGIVFLSTFIYVPPTIHYLGPERYGLWVAITSIVTLLTFADCGVGYGLMNQVAYAIGQDEKESVRKSISNSFFVLLMIAVVGCVSFAAVFPFVDWQTALRIRTAADAADAAKAIAAMVLCFLATLPFSTVQRVQAAYQEGFEAQLWEIVGVCFSVGGLLAAIHLHAELAVLAVLFSIGPLLGMVLNWLFYFCVRRPWEAPLFRLFASRAAWQSLHEGSYFLVLQLASIVIFSIDTFLILHYFGEAALGKYNLAVKLFQVMPALAAVWYAPLWPAYADAIARHDQAWVRRTLMRSVVVGSLGCASISTVVALFARPAIHLWTGADVDPSVRLLAGFVVYSTVVVGTGAIAAYLNGSNFIRGQALLVIISALLNVALKVGLCKYGDISGAIWGSNLSFLLFVVPVYCVIVPRLLREQARVG